MVTRKPDAQSPSRPVAQLPKTAERHMWALGDYHTFATATVWQLGPVLVDACGIARGQRVLDVATGTGNVAIRAAERGASVVAVDLTPEHFVAGRRAARAAGVDIEWIEGDAEALPCGSGEFDVVTSCFGAMFAPDHHAVANELLRVCRTGGTIGLINFTPGGCGGDFFRVLAPYMPPAPSDAMPPILWGDEKHVRELFDDRVEFLELARREYVETAADARDYLQLFRSTFGPMVAIYDGLASEPARAATLDRAFLDFVARANRGTPGERIQIPYEYLLIVARKRA